MMKVNKAVAAWTTIGLLLIGAVAWAGGGEMTITGVISGVNPATRIATVTPANGAPIVVQFAFNAGGPCNTCMGVGRPGHTFAETVAAGWRWRLTDSASRPDGGAESCRVGTVQRHARSNHAEQT